MKNEIINKALDFLVTDYNCSLSYEFDHGSTYIYRNDIFKIVIFTWEQFDDLDVNLVYDLVNYHIDPYLEEPQKMSIINSKKKGIKGFFYNYYYDSDFWNIISLIIKNKLNQLGIK